MNRERYLLLNTIIVVLASIGIISCDNGAARMTAEQRAALHYLDSTIDMNDSIISIKVIDYFSCSEDTVWALFNDRQYKVMRDRESELFHEIMDERYKMREYEYNSDRHRWNIERLQDEQNQLKEDMSEYEKHFCPPQIANVALIQYITKLNPNRRYMCLAYNHSHNKVIREIKNIGKTGFCIFIENNKYGIKLNAYNDTVLPPNYDSISRFSDYGCNCFLLCDKGKYGLYDDTLGIVISPEFDSIIIKSGFYVKPVYIVKKHDVWGMFNDIGKIIIPIKYDGILFPSKGYTSDIDESDTICFVKKGGEQKGIWFGSVNPAVTDNGMWGVYKTSGEQVAPCKYNFNDIQNDQQNNY